jgi:hypothetical protein
MSLGSQISRKNSSVSRHIVAGGKIFAADEPSAGANLKSKILNLKFFFGAVSLEAWRTTRKYTQLTHRNLRISFQNSWLYATV